MKVNATFQHTFQVTRTVEIDDEHFREWCEAHARRTGRPLDREDAIKRFIGDLDAEDLNDLWPDWKAHQPLPGDFELMWSDVSDVERLSADSSNGGDRG